MLSISLSAIKSGAIILVKNTSQTSERQNPPNTSLAK